MFLCAIFQCSLTERKQFLHETTHNKVCRLSWVTESWILERHITIDCFLVVCFFFPSPFLLSPSQSQKQPGWLNSWKGKRRNVFFSIRVFFMNNCFCFSCQELNQPITLLLLLLYEANPPKFHDTDSSLTLKLGCMEGLFSLFVLLCWKRLI